MRITGEVKIKNDVTLEDKINVIDTVIPFIISKDDNGKTNYTPYYRETGVIVGVTLYLLNGIEFEEDDVNVYDAVISNKKIFDVITSFMSTTSETMKFINKHIDSIVAFRKQEYFHSLNNKIEERLTKAIDKEIALNEALLKVAKNESRVLSAQAKQLEYSEKVAEIMTPEETAEMNKMMLSGKFDTNKMAEIVTEKFLNSDIHKKNEKEIIDTQAGKIKELQEYKREHDAKNVKA